jgi:hypothetical protein
MEESLGMFLSQDQINPLERSSSPTISRKIWELPNAGADKKKTAQILYTFRIF